MAVPVELVWSVAIAVVVNLSSSLSKCWEPCETRPFEQYWHCFSVKNYMYGEILKDLFYWESSVTEISGRLCCASMLVTSLIPNAGFCHN